ncbi:MAG: S41 family peptidase [Anderseniella sp.]|nr:S41 family peptidase [Anderseniella sp.]
MQKTNLKIAGAFMLGAVAATGGWLSLNQAVASNQDTYRYLNLFGDVFDRVRSDYVEEPDSEKLIDTAINGMLTGLDPHSSYMNPKRFKDMQVQTRGEFGGLGIEVTMENEVVKVVAPIDETPAQKAGILANDLITHIDGKEVRGMNLNEAVDKMRGKVKTPIVLTIVRKGMDAPFDVTIIRDIIKIRAVRYNVESDDIGYIRISSFNDQTQDNLEKAIAKLKEELGDKLKGYVIDLRNNPGGLLNQAISVSDSFLDRGVIVSTRGRSGAETDRSTATNGDLSDGKKIVVLINGGSASASEIVAGALQDHKRATILGTRSFGKGSVQTIIPLGSEGAIRLTTARYYTPSNTSIQAKGIVPDIKIEQELPEELKAQAAKNSSEASLRGHLSAGDGEEATGSSSYVPADKEKDLQLKAAIDLLDGKTVNPTPQKAEAPKKDGETTSAN